MKAPKRKSDERGSGLLVALLVLGALSVLGSSLVLTSVGDRTATRYVRHSIEALGSAESGLAYAKRHIQDLTAPIEDYDEDGRQDFTLADSMSWGGSYRLEISSVSGAIYTKVPLSVEKVTRHELSGDVGSGKGSVTLSTSSGDIKVYEG